MHIRKDEEFSISYSPSCTPHSKRLEFLSRQISFVCVCPACILPPEKVSEKDAAVDQVEIPHEMVGMVCFTMRQGPRQRIRNFIIHIEGVEVLSERYGLGDYLARAYAMLGDRERSQEWTRKSQSVSRLCCVSRKPLPGGAVYGYV